MHYKLQKQNQIKYMQCFSQQRSSKKIPLEKNTKNIEYNNYMNYQNKNKKNFIPIRPESMPNISKKSRTVNEKMDNKLDYNKEEDYLNENLALLHILWEDLGISLDYRILFENHVKKLNDNERKDVINLEKHNLKNFREILLKLNKEIRKREKNIKNLIKLSKSIEISCNEEKIIPEESLKDVVNLIKSLRLNAVNIINNFFEADHKAFYYLNSGKLNISKMNKFYSYNPTYLYKMENDLKFLEKSILNRYIEFQNNEFDAFLTNCAHNDSPKSKKIVIPISNDLMKHIKNCRYLLLQETLSTSPKKNFFKNTFSIDNTIMRKNLSPFNDKNFENNFYRISNQPSIKTPTKSKIKNIMNMSQKLHKYKIILGKGYNNIFLKSKDRNFATPKDNQTIIKSKINTFMENCNNLKKINNRNSLCSRIKIEHDEIKLMTKEEFLKSLERYKNLYAGKIPEENKRKNLDGNDTNHSMNKNIEEKKIKSLIESNRLKLENEDYKKFREEENIKDKKDYKEPKEYEIKLKNKNEKKEEQKKRKRIIIERYEENH